MSLKRKFAIDIEPVPATADATEPVLVSFGGVRPPPLETPFSVYRSSLTTAPVGSVRAQYRVVTAETPTLQLYGDNYSEPSGAEDQCEYYVGVVDRERGKVRIMRAPVVHLDPKLKLVSATVDERVDKSSMMASRNALGETFGNKRAKSAIKAIERGKIDADALDRAADNLQSTVAMSLDFVPTPEALAQELALDDPLPPHDAETDDVTKVYPISQLFPAAYRSSLERVAVDLLKHQSPEALAELKLRSANDPDVGPAGPTYMEREIFRLMAVPKPTKRDITRCALALYALYLARLGLCREATLKRHQTVHEQTGMPLDMAAALTAAFCEKVAVAANRSRVTVTPRARTRITCHVLAVLLHLQSFALSAEDVARDVDEKIDRVQMLLRGMGCSSTSLSAAQLKERGESGLERKSTRFSLSAPLRIVDLTKRKGGKPGRK
ncbi:RNA polymerase I associated factor, A49-like protein [Blastocladiella britannica]|nr:RNA polymerase I associated factor, A49-like protein [Blastocladiella britannica]